MSAAPAIPFERYVAGLRKWQERWRALEEANPYSPDTVRWALRAWIACDRRTEEAIKEDVVRWGKHFTKAQRAELAGAADCALSQIRGAHRRAAEILSEFARTHNLDQTLFAPAANITDVAAVAGVAARVVLALNAPSAEGRRERLTPNGASLERALALLSPQQGRILEFLWEPRTASYGALRGVPHAWQGNPSDKAIGMAFTRMKQRLEAADVWDIAFTNSTAGERVNLERPPD